MTLFLKSVKRLLDNFFELPDFCVVEGLELSLPPPLRKRPAILLDEHEEVLGKPVRHVDRVHDTAHRLVMPAQVVDLARQVGFDCTLNKPRRNFRYTGVYTTFVQKLSLTYYTHKQLFYIKTLSRRPHSLSSTSS